MNAALRCLGLLVIGTGVAGEATGVIPALGVSLVLGICLGTYLWFLAVARQTMRSAQRRRS